MTTRNTTLASPRNLIPRAFRRVVGDDVLLYITEKKGAKNTFLHSRSFSCRLRTIDWLYRTVRALMILRNLRRRRVSLDYYL